MSLTAAQHGRSVPPLTCITCRGTLVSASASTHLPPPTLPLSNTSQPKGLALAHHCTCTSSSHPPLLSSAPTLSRTEAHGHQVSAVLPPWPSLLPLHLPLAHFRSILHSSCQDHPNTQHTLNSAGPSGRLKGEALEELCRSRLRKVALQSTDRAQSTCLQALGLGAHVDCTGNS